MREVLQIVKERNPHLMIDGEMRGDLAMNEAHRKELMFDSPLKGSANLLVFPDLSASRISYSFITRHYYGNYRWPDLNGNE